MSGKFEGLPEGIKKIITNAGPGFQKAGQAVLNNAYKAGTQGGLKLIPTSDIAIHNALIDDAIAIKEKRPIFIYDVIPILHHGNNVFSICSQMMCPIMMCAS